ncbi:TniQ family protein [Streptomyces sp. SID12501]|uniref:TniQ family protein n=1 Tax=Streptomyces sp. SID12501 TaxID=2706042 RepID=A0A6B3C4C9_9ACTN|nr:TniQ family protein [Streptomyces sp. SID12501]NEC91090.1 TniQ family protein [Streptomyces sp. SID12501]
MSTSLRRLALVPEPYPGESLLSWVDAFAGLNRISRLQAIRFAAFVRPGSSGYRPSVRFVAHLPTEAMARVQVTTGLSAEQLRRMTLMHYADGVLPSPPSATHRRTIAAWLNRLQLAHPISSRACPACLRENGGRWLLRWRLIWSFACVRHRVFLLSACRGCGKGLHQVLPGPGSAVVCGQYDWNRPGDACPRSIWHMRPPKLLDTHLLECQRRLDDLVDHPHCQGAQDILRTLHVALENICINYDEAPSLPDTDVVLHRRWHGHGGVLSYADDPLLTAALIKIATVGGLGTSQDAVAQADTASWSTDGFPQPNTDAPPVNRFGGSCRAIACPSWALPGQGAVVYAKDGPYALCSAHVDHAIAPGR